LIKLAGGEDIKLKKIVGDVIYKLARIDRNTNYLRESGALPVLVANLSHFDSGTVSSSARALSNMAKNGKLDSI
jgi:hypothetical protein